MSQRSIQHYTVTIIKPLNSQNHLMLLLPLGRSQNRSGMEDGGTVRREELITQMGCPMYECLLNKHHHILNQPE